MENLRRIVQVLAFAGFIHLFLLTVGRYDPAARRMALTSSAPIDTFFRIDPLLGLVTMICVRRVIYIMLVYALPVVILTLLIGRFFCGWICPLGTTLDAADTLFYRGRRRAPSRAKASSGDGWSERGSARNVKYYLLVVVLAGAVFSAQFACFFDPITILTRALTFAVFPIVQLTADELGLSGSPVLGAFVPSGVNYFFRLNFTAALALLGIIAANSISRRWWCRNLCPLGALLALLSRFSIMRRIVDSKCTNCGKCAPACKMGAIHDDPARYQAPECIYCYSCTPVCPALSARIVPAVRTPGYHASFDLTRRRTVQAIGGGALLALLANTNLAAKTSRTGRLNLSSEALIRPPGALPEHEFVDRCIRCSECMKVCPTGGLQPAITEAGIAGLWTPVLVPRAGECAQHCNLCAQVCSSQAIQPFEVEEKPWIFMGRAVIDRSACIAWNSDKQCLVCDEYCSYHAVYWETVDGVKRPFVDEHRCVGCGICENACPIQPQAAIRVFSFGDQRHRSREEQKAFFQQARPRGEPPSKENQQ